MCLFRPESDVLTSAVVRSTVDYIMAANSEEIKLFDIDKKTGEYVSFKKSDLAYGKVNFQRTFRRNKHCDTFCCGKVYPRFYGS